MSAAMAWVIEPVDVEREWRVAAAKLSREFRHDFLFALYEADRQILHGRTWSLKWNGERAIIM